MQAGGVRTASVVDRGVRTLISPESRKISEDCICIGWIQQTADFFKSRHSRSLSGQLLIKHQTRLVGVVFLARYVTRLHDSTAANLDPLKGLKGRPNVSPFIKLHCRVVTRSQWSQRYRTRSCSLGPRGNPLHQCFAVDRFRPNRPFAAYKLSNWRAEQAICRISSETSNSKPEGDTRPANAPVREYLFRHPTLRNPIERALNDYHRLASHSRSPSRWISSVEPGNLSRQGALPNSPSQMKRASRGQEHSRRAWHTSGDR